MVKKISKGVYFTDKGIVDLNAKQELSPSQKFHNSIVDLEIDEANRYNKMVNELNALKQKQWGAFLKENPDHPFKACPNLDIRSPKRVIRLRYVP